MPGHIDVFISSTSKDLGKYRAKVKETVLAQGMYPIAMEEFQPSRANALQTCYDALQKAEVFVGIYAHRYGYAPGADHHYTTESGETRAGDGETSITHLEYRWAIEKGLPLLLFVLADKDEEGEPLAWPLDYVEDEPGKSRLKAFKGHIGDQHIIKFFTTPADLAEKVASALAAVPRETASAGPAPRRRRDFYEHQKLPEGYVPRVELLAELRTLLLGDAAVTAVTSGVTYRPKSEPTALHGIGGIGKSVMARALCDDPLVQALFPDGILWVTLGNEMTDADIDTKLRAWVFALGGALADGATTDNVREELARLLKDKACLLIVDDVWKRKQAERFTVGGPGCRVLMTTRDAEIARALGADVHAVPPMTEGEALALLEEWAKRGLGGVDAARKRTIVHKLGRLPLAIKLAGAQLQKTDPAEWLRTFDARKLKSARPEDPHDSLEQTFGMSLDALDSAERRLYAALTIFREDEDISQAAAARLWEGLGSLPEDACARLIDDLAARALLETVGERYPRAIKLHDLLRDFMEHELGAAGAVPAHAALLAAYRGSAPAWHAVADDGYLYAHLGYHLLAAGRRAELYALLTAAPDWMEASRRALAGDQGCAADLERMIALYADPLTPDELVELAALWAARQVIHARVGAYTDDDLRILVLIDLNIDKDGRRTAEAINAARLRDDPNEKVEGLLVIEKTLREGGVPRPELLDEAHAASDAVKNASERASALRAVAGALAAAGRPEADSVFAQARATADATGNPYDRARALGDLAAVLVAAGHFTEARAAADAIEDASKRASALSDLAGALAAASRFAEARDTIDIIEHGRFHALALSDLAGALAAAGRFDEALATVATITVDSQRADALSALFGGLVATSHPKADAIFRAARAVADKLEGERERAVTLSALAAALAAAGHFAEARDAVDAVEHTSRRADSLLDLYMVPSAARFLKKRDAVECSRQHADALSTLAVALAAAGRPEAYVTFKEAWAAADAINDDRQRAAALSGLAAALAKADYPEADAAFTAAQVAAKAVDPEFDGRGSALRTLATAYINAGRFDEALDAAKAVDPEFGDRADALRTLAAKFAAIGRFAEARAAADAIDLNVTRTAALRALATTLASASRLEADEAFNAVRDNANTMHQLHGHRACTMRAVATVLADAGHSAADAAFTAARSATDLMDDDLERASTLRDLASAMAAANRLEADDAIDAAWEAAEAIDDEFYLASALRDLSGALAAVGRFAKSREIADTIHDSAQQAFALSNLTAALTAGGRFAEARDTADTIEAVMQRAVALSALATALATTGYFVAARAAADAIDVDSLRADILSYMGANLSAVGRPEVNAYFNVALAAAAAIQVKEGRAFSLRNLATAQATAGRYAEARAAVDAIKDAYWRANALRELAATLAAAGRFDEARAAADAIDSAYDRAPALRDLAAALAKAGRFAGPQGAFNTFGLHELNGYLQIMAEWAPAFVKVDAALPVRVLRECVRIVAWVQPAGREMAALLARGDAAAGAGGAGGGDPA